MAGNRKPKVDWALIVPEATAERVIERLEAARHALGLSQVEFLRRIPGHPISPQQYTNWKNGERPSVDQAVAICKAHRLNLDYLYRGELSDIPNDVHDSIAAQLLRPRRKRA